MVSLDNFKLLYVKLAYERPNPKGYKGVESISTYEEV